MKTNKIWTGLLVLVIMAAACKKKDNSDLSPLVAEEIMDESYGDNPLNTMDIYLPEGRTDTTKVILLLHGGSWFEGDKDSLAAISDSLRDRGFAAININYRLTNTVDSNRLKDLINDIDLAVGHVSSNTKKWNVSASKFGFLGVSSGAHLALLYTYAFNDENRIKTVVSLAGPTNLTDRRNVGPIQDVVVRKLLGAGSITSAYITGSPITYVGTLTKPTLIFHGKKDVVVPIQQSIDLKSKLNQVNVKHKMVIYDNDGHEFLDKGTRANIFLETEKWFRENLK